MIGPMNYHLLQQERLYVEKRHNEQPRASKYGVTYYIKRRMPTGESGRKVSTRLLDMQSQICDYTTTQQPHHPCGAATQDGSFLQCLAIAINGFFWRTAKPIQALELDY